MAVSPIVLRDNRLRPRCLRLRVAGWGFEPGVEDAIVDRLTRELRSGEWARKYGALRTTAEFHGALRIVVGDA